MKTRLGFTLIELLVVIAIIALIAAILYPVFAAAREKARSAACMSNAKQIGLALMQYTQDYDELLPGGTDPSQSGTGWAGQIYSYVKSFKAFECPDDTDNPASTYKWPSFAINMDLSVHNPTALTNAGISVSQFTSPALTVVLFEVTGSTDSLTAADETGSPGGYGLGSIYGQFDPVGLGANNNCNTYTMKFATGYLGNRSFTTPDPCYANNGVGRHNGGSNFILADGHAKWLLGNQVSSGSEPASSTANETIEVSTNRANNDAAGTAGKMLGQTPVVTFSYL